MLARTLAQVQKNCTGGWMPACRRRACRGITTEQMNQEGNREVGARVWVLVSGLESVLELEWVSVLELEWVSVKVLEWVSVKVLEPALERVLESVSERVLAVMSERVLAEVLEWVLVQVLVVVLARVLAWVLAALDRTPHYTRSMLLCPTCPFHRVPHRTAGNLVRGQIQSRSSQTPAEKISMGRQVMIPCFGMELALVQVLVVARVLVMEWEAG